MWGSNGPMPVNRPVGCLPGCVPLCQSPEPDPCHREAFAAHAEPCENLCAGRKDPRPLLRGRNHRAGSQAGGYEAVGIEVTDAYYKLGSDRVRFALEAQPETAE